MLPSLFLSHGSPMLPLTDVPARHFLQGLGARLARPTAIVVASAHWLTPGPMVNAVAVNATIHDFGGFPRALYEMRYPAPGSPALADRIAALFGQAGLACETDGERGLDHGAWVPLSMIYPAADIPVVQVALQPHLGPAHHLRIGAALAPLRAENVLVIGSGSLTHNLRELRRDDAEEPDWVRAFADWVGDAIAQDRLDDLLAYRTRAPWAERNHPTDEHFLPLFVARGAAGPTTLGRQIHASATHAALRMDAYAFGEPDGIL